MVKIAFIGLGHMGGGMAPNLVKAGHEVRAFDLSKDAVDKAVEAGCSAAPSAADAVRESDVVVTMLPAAQHVRAVYEKDVAPNATKGALLIDCSTIDVASARDVGEGLRAQGFNFVDAPVSGGIAAAMAKAVIHAGGAGAGQAAKICNNMILGATMIVTCEAFVMAQKLGLDPQVFFDIASNASGQSWSMTSYTPVPGVGPDTPADHDYEGGFAAALMLKDLKLAMDAAQHAGAYTPLGGQAEELYQRFVNLGGGSKDFSGIIKMLDDSWKAPTQE